MTVPLIILAAASVFSGVVPFDQLVTSDGKPFEAHFHWSIAVPSVLIALAGIGVSYTLYYKENNRAERITAKLSGFYKAAFNKFYLDELYLFITHKIIFKFISKPVAWFDRNIVDGTMNLIGNGTVYFSVALKRIQSGQVQLYILFFASGALLLTLIMLYLN